ncbi:MAG TPA: dTMP kinase [Candidatus Tectomicrobia bacterium]|nr:dTMP kinase [Candidatus Tectomicrobia bacterium]
MTPHRPLPRGILVALEGIDGTGKSTQVRRLTAAFSAEGYDVLSLSEPTHSPWGRRLREAMTAGRRLLAPSQELDLFLQDRRYDVAAHIKPALAARKLVFMDRYYFSTMAYQGALGLDPETIRRLNEAFAPVPDLVFLLLVSPDRALERIRQGRGQTDDVFEREDDLRRVDGIFRTLQGPQIDPVAADQPIDAVTATLHKKIQAILGACSLTPPSAALRTG